MFKSNILFILLLSSILSGCGKKAKESEATPNQRPGRETRNIDLDVLLKNQVVECEDKNNCPNNIAKIVITNKSEVRNCTGILIKSDRLLTSASCLPRNLRTASIDCSAFIFAVFPESQSLKTQSILCDEVLFSDKLRYEPYPELWSNDVAVLKLKKKLNKRKITGLYRKGVSQRSYTLWKVDALTDKLGIIKKTKCKSLRETYLDPFSSNAFSSMFVSTGCELVEGNSGAPLIRANKVVGLYAKEMSSRLYTMLESSNILSEEIGQYYHFSSLSCSPYSNNLLLSHRVPKECLKLKNFSLLNRFRSSILKNKIIHRSGMKRIERELEKPATYFMWDVMFDISKNGRSFEAYYSRPKCLYDVKGWIDEFSTFSRRGTRKVKSKVTKVLEVPKYIFHTKLNKELKPVSVIENNKVKQYTVSFSPSGAYFRQKTNVDLVSMRNGESYDERFSKINDKCANSY